MSRPATAPNIVARRPEDVLATVPYLLGFHPTESLVVVALRAPRNRVVCTMRVDLPPIRFAGAVADQLLGAAGHSAASGVLVIAYSADAEPADSIAAQVSAAFAGAGMTVLGVWRSDSSRWWCRCTSGSCSRPEGGTLYDAAGPCAAEAVSHGLVALADRSEVAAMVTAAPEREAKTMGELTVRTAARLGVDGEANSSEADLDRRGQSWVERFLATFASRPRWLTNSEVALLSAWLVRIHVRDAAWCLLDRAAIDAHISLWQQMTRRAAPGYVAAPAALLAFAAWLAGRGALAQCALDRVFAEDPDYSMGWLIAETLSSGLPPSMWQPLTLAQLHAATVEASEAS